MNTSRSTTRRIWAYISKRPEEGRPFTYRSIARAIGHPGSLQTVWSAIDRLEALGYVVREKPLPDSKTKVRVVIPLCEHRPLHIRA